MGEGSLIDPIKLVDVGIPTHDRPVFVVEAVESVLAQTFERWRLVVSEDGPGNPEVAAALRPYLDDPRVTHEVSGRPLGAAANMSRVLASGSAPYVAILHDDDRWEPEFLERRVDFLEAHPECAFVFSGHMDIDGNGDRTGHSKLRLDPGRPSPRRSSRCCCATTSSRLPRSWFAGRPTPPRGDASTSAFRGSTTGRCRSGSGSRAPPGSCPCATPPTARTKRRAQPRPGTRAGVPRRVRAWRRPRGRAGPCGPAARP